MKYYLYLIPLLGFVACSEEKTTQQEAIQTVQGDEARIARLAQSVKLNAFYVADPNDPSTNEDKLTKDGVVKFREKSGLYKNAKLVERPQTVLERQYRTFVNENTGNPYLRRFRRDASETILLQSKSLSISERVYHIRELITNRSDDLNLIRVSLGNIQGKVSSTEHKQLVGQTQQLFDQYETHFKNQLANFKGNRGTTFRDKFTSTVQVEFAKQALAKIEENRRLLAAAE